MKLILSYISLILIFIDFINGQTQPLTLTLNGVIYDNLPKLNPNFEPQTGSVTKGLVKTILDDFNRSPELVSTLVNNTNNINGRIVRPDLFNAFFNQVDGINIAIPHNITLNYNSATGVYTYTNLKFFPINNKGFDENPANRIYKDGSGVYQNFHFCYRVNSNFTYRGYETLNFFGDDDFWVYIDNKLAIDLGGLHTQAGASVDLTKLGLLKNKNNTIDFFYCERHTTESNLKLETNILLYCAQHDYCGVCNGDGSGCCNAATTCNDNNPCTDDSCPTPQTNIQSGNIKDYCIHIPTNKILSTPEDKCFIHQCNSTSLKVDLLPIPCLDKSNECLINTGCNTSTGCQYTSICQNNICSINGQCNNGTCVTKTPDQCANELDGKVDVCQVYSCDPLNGGCIKKDKCPQSSNKCIITSCSSINGECIDTPVSNPYENNSCVTAVCNPNTGIFDVVPILCDRSDECLVNTGCNPSTGCQFESLCNNVCEIQGQCNNGTCVTKTPDQCANELDGKVDLCQVYSCDPSGNGCIKQDKCPQSLNKCIITSCSSINGECIDTPVSNPYENDTCVTAVCNQLTGIFEPTEITCQNRTNECFVNVGCDSKSGCEYESTCTSKCYKCSNGDCLKKDKYDCGLELDGYVDPCMTYGCSETGGCYKKPKCQAPKNNKCQIAECRVNATTGNPMCYAVFKPEIENNDPCKVIDCDPCTGTITTLTLNKCKVCRNNDCSNSSSSSSSSSSNSSDEEKGNKGKKNGHKNKK